MMLNTASLLPESVTQAFSMAPEQILNPLTMQGRVPCRKNGSVTA